MGRDYKDEYEKFQSSQKQIDYRKKLNKYNRDKGTYGNGDGKDASHGKDGKITGFVDSSTNKGRKEKSRLKGSPRVQRADKGGKIKGNKNKEVPIIAHGKEIIINEIVNGAASKHEKKLLALNKNPDDYEIIKKNSKLESNLDYNYPIKDSKKRRA